MCVMEIIGMQSAPQPTEIRWRIHLFDGIWLEDAAGNRVHRFRSQRAGALLAYLALHLGHACPREELCEALWPEEDLLLTANRLRVALASLRRQLEPMGILFGAVLDVSEPGCVRLRAEAVWCDAIEFDRLWKAGKQEEAARLLQGDLLPGFYDEWILTERNRYALLAEEWKAAAPPSQSESATEETPQPSPLLTPEPQRRLPLYLTRFFGRETEREQLQSLLLADRLITLTGAGGIGKTRLAVETARQIRLPSVFIPLADLPDPERVPEAILQALLIVPQPNVDPRQQLIAVLKVRGPLLLILDNAEHLVAAVSALTLQLLEALPELRLLITSRQRLEIPGEVTMALLPLEPPPHASAPMRLAEFPAVALFLDRARAARPDFTLSERHVDALVNICLRLEGMPLALELAAARVTTQTPAQIAESLETGLMDLKSRQRGLSERHRSLRAAIQGSFELLSPELQAFFCALSVFQGGWTVEAARAVTGCGEAEAYLEELLIRSLVTVREDEARGILRYAFLETLRQFAAEQLSETEQTQWRERHAGYFLTLAAAVSEEDIRSFSPLDAEQENLLAALDWDRAGGSSRFWSALTGVLTHAFVRGHHRRSQGWAEEAQAAVASLPDTDQRFHLRRAAGAILMGLGRYEEALRMAEEAESDANANGDRIRAAFSVSRQGYAVCSQGHRERALKMLRSALQQARHLEDDYLLTRCLSLTTMALANYGGLLGNETIAGSAMLREAVDLGKELVALLPPHSSLLSTAWHVLFLALNCQGKSEETYHTMKESQRIAIAHQKMPVLMFALLYEAQYALDLGEDAYAAKRFGGFLETHERMGYHLGTYSQWIEALQAQLRERLGSEAFESLVRQGRQTPFEAFVVEPLPSRPTGPHASKRQN